MSEPVVRAIEELTNQLRVMMEQLAKISSTTAASTSKLHEAIYESVKSINKGVESQSKLLYELEAARIAASIETLQTEFLRLKDRVEKLNEKAKKEAEILNKELEEILHREEAKKEERIKEIDNHVFKFLRYSQELNDLIEDTAKKSAVFRELSKILLEERSNLLKDEIDNIANKIKEYENYLETLNKEIDFFSFPIEKKVEIFEISEPDNKPNRRNLIEFSLKELIKYEDSYKIESHLRKKLGEHMHETLLSILRE
jgi:enolase